MHHLVQPDGEVMIFVLVFGVFYPLMALAVLCACVFGISVSMPDISQLDRGSPEATRAALMAPSRTGRSRYEEIAALSRRDVVRAPDGVRPAQLLDARHDDADPTGELVDFERHGGEAG